MAIDVYTRLVDVNIVVSSLLVSLCLLVAILSRGGGGIEKGKESDVVGFVHTSTTRMLTAMQIVHTTCGPAPALYAYRTL